MQRLTRLSAIAVVAVAALSLPARAQSNEAGQNGSARQFRAGAATSNVTPMLGSKIVGNFVEPEADYVHDELHARCLVLDDGTTRIGFVVVDSVGVVREVFDEARKLLAERHVAIDPQNVVMSATHTHSATSARGERLTKQDGLVSDYQRFLALRIADGLARAIKNLEPAQIAWGSATEQRPLFNRRYFVKPGTELLSPVGSKDLVKMNPGYENPNVVGPAGPTDPEVSFIFVRSISGRPISLLANYSLHYVGGVGERVISADYYGVFCDKIQQKLGADRLSPPFVGIMTNGTSGDVNNINAMGPKPAKKKDFEQIDAVAEMVADGVFKAQQSVEFRNIARLKSLQRELKLGVRKPTPAQIERSRKLLAHEVKSAVYLEEPYAERMIELAEGPDEYSVPLQTLQIGDLGIATIPFEVFTQSGLDIKKRSPFKPTFTIELANGSYGYLPTAEQHKLGGYETWIGTNNVEVDAASKIVDQLMAMFGELKSAK